MPSNLYCKLGDLSHAKYKACTTQLQPSRGVFKVKRCCHTEVPPVHCPQPLTGRTALLSGSLLLSLTWFLRQHTWRHTRSVAQTMPRGTYWSAVGSDIVPGPSHGLELLTQRTDQSSRMCSHEHTRVLLCFRRHRQSCPVSLCPTFSKA